MGGMGVAVDVFEGVGVVVGDDVLVGVGGIMTSLGSVGVGNERTGLRPGVGGSTSDTPSPGTILGLTTGV